MVFMALIYAAEDFKILNLVMTTTDDSDTAGERERLREWIKVVARRQAGGKTHTAFVFIKPHAVYEKARINSGL